MSSSHGAAGAAHPVDNDIEIIRDAGAENERIAAGDPYGRQNEDLRSKHEGCASGTAKTGPPRTPEHLI